MKHSMILKFALILWYSIGFYAASAQPQSLYRAGKPGTGNIKLSGTSSLHNWDMNSKVFSGEALFIFDQVNRDVLTSIPSLTFTLAVAQLKSDDKKLDKNAYKALKGETFRNIVYKLKSATIQKGAGNAYVLKTTGSLSIAGVTKQVSMDVHCIVNKDATISCTGTEQLKMSDYGVKPPTFMLGAMKTGDNVSLNFNIVYSK